MEDTVLEQDPTFAGVEARSQSGTSPIVTPGQAGGVPITQIQSGTSGFSAPQAGGIATVTSPLTTKGDILVRDATQGTRQPVGANKSRLTPDSTQTTGLKWVPTSTGWNAPTGTLARGTYAAYVGQTVSNPPTQGEMQTLDDAVKLMSQTLAAALTDLRTQEIFST